MQSFQTFLKLGLKEPASRGLVMLSRYERLHGSIKKAASLNDRALDILKDRERGGPYYYFSLQQLLIEHATAPSRNIYKRLVDLHREAKEKKLEQQYEIAREIARVAQDLRLMPDAVRWSKKVHEYEIERLNSEQQNAILSLKTQQEVERLAKERELDKLKMDKLELELASKERETKLLAVQLAKKGSFLATLTNQIALLKSSKYSPETIDAVVELIETIRFRDKDYEQLEERAETLHHDFIVALSERFPDLTAAEKRICILLKLGLSSVDIANVLFTSVRTIETHCLSIRKKLRIARTTRLSKFIVEFERPLQSST